MRGDHTCHVLRAQSVPDKPRNSFSRDNLSIRLGDACTTLRLTRTTPWTVYVLRGFLSHPAMLTLYVEVYATVVGTSSALMALSRQVDRCVTAASPMYIRPGSRWSSRGHNERYVDA